MTKLMKAQSGFTLLELMIVVVVVAILASIAYPAYTDYIIRSRIPEATSTLATKRIQMEQWFQDNRTYLTTSGDPPPPCNVDTTSSTAFSISCASGSVTANSYTLQAVGNAGGPASGFVYTIDQSNTKLSNISRPGWSNPNPNNCWAIRKNGNCS